MLKWMILFMALPIAEIYLYIKLGAYIGIWPTVLMIIGTGVLGVALAKQQGFYILTRIRQDLEIGAVPGNQVVEGFLVLVGAIFLVTPGLITDTIGFILLVPFTRIYIREILKIKVRKWIREGKFNFYFHYR